MKISQKQATLLAKEIIRQLNAKKSFKVSAELRAQIKQYCERRKELWDKVNEAKEIVNRHEMTLRKIVGPIDHIYTSDSLERIIEKVEAKNVPSISSIEDEIILQSMFESEDDMQLFVDKLVTKHSKKYNQKFLIINQMKKTIKYTIIIALCVLFSASAFSQNVTKQNGLTDSVALWNKRIDSVLSTTTIKLFQSWLYENATVKQYQEGKFVDLYNAFVQRQYEIWIASKSQPKK